MNKIITLIQLMKNYWLYEWGMNRLGVKGGGVKKWLGAGNGNGDGNGDGLHSMSSGESDDESRWLVMRYLHDVIRCLLKLRACLIVAPHRGQPQGWSEADVPRIFPGGGGAAKHNRTISLPTPAHGGNWVVLTIVVNQLSISKLLTT